MVEKTIGRDDTVESERVTYDSMLMEIIKIGNSQWWFVDFFPLRDNFSHTMFHCCGHCVVVS